MPGSDRQGAGPAGPGYEYEYGHQAADGPVRRYHHRDMTQAEVARAVRPGSRRARDQREARDAALDCPDLAGVRGDFRRNLEAWIRVHVAHASWGGDGRPPACVTSPGRKRTCELIPNPRTGKPMSAATYKRCRAWWAERGYICVVRPGWTPDLKAASLVGPDDACQSQAYVMCVPRRQHPKKARLRPQEPPHPLNEPLTVFSKKTVLLKQGGREKNRTEQRPGASCCYPRRNPVAAGMGAPRHAVLRRGTLAALSDRQWAILTAPFADWLAADVVWAVDHDRDGRQHPGRSDTVRYPAAWLRWRLAHWLQPDGTACPSPAATRAAAAHAARAEQAARREESAATAAAALRSLAEDRVTAAAAAARELLAARSKDAAAVIARTAATRPAATPPQAPRSAAVPPATTAADFEAWLTRRAARDDAARPRGAPESPPRSQPPAPGWWQDAVDAAVAAVAAAELGDPPEDLAGPPAPDTGDAAGP